jgi:hypothetical protein
MVRGTWERESPRRRSPAVAVAIAAGSLIVLATAMEAQTRGAVAAGSIGQHPAWTADPAPLASNGMTAQQLVDRIGQSGWDTFSARMVVRRQMVAADGSSVGTPPATTEYTWERTRRGAGWKTTMTMVTAPEVRVKARSGVVTLPQSPTVTKMEDLGDGSAPRSWALNGTEIKMPSPARQVRVMGLDATVLGASMAEDMLQGAYGVRAVPHAASPNWIDVFIMPMAGRRQRLEAFERQFGRRRGVVQGLSRHVRQEGEGEREVLVDDETGVPIEANLVARGELIAHSTFSYNRAVSGAIVRRGVHTERVLSGSRGARMVTEMSFNDITVEQRGGR